MDRRQREAELRALLTSPQGEDELLDVYRRHAGASSAEGGPTPSGSRLVEAVLDFEYQTEGVPQQGRAAGTEDGPPPTTPESAAPGDLKFSDPPGTEAPGG